MTRVMAAFAALFVVLAVIEAALLHWGWASFEPFLMAPRVPFAALPPLPKGAYAAPGMWLSRPGLADDPARFLPPGAAPAQPGPAYAFVVHPTTYMARNHWNAPLDHADSRMRAGMALESMASVFGTATVYAPRYRQAARGTFLIDHHKAPRALALAEGDVRIAFARFLAEIPPNAPIVLAGHSQGAAIVLRLLRDAARDPALAPRIVAVYLAGWPVSAAHDLPLTGLAPCTRPDQTRCAMAWTSFAEPADPREFRLLAARYPALDGTFDSAAPVCTNPLTGGADAAAPGAANPGSLMMAQEFSGPKLVRGRIGARCDRASGLLMISDPPRLGDEILSGRNYSTYDFPLFWAALRADAARRTAAWTMARGA